MNIRLRIQSLGWVGFLRLMVAGAILVLVLAVFFYWRPSWHCERKQASLIEAIEDNKGKKLRQLVSPSYSDRWKFGRDDLILAVSDVRSQFITLSINPREQKWSFSGDTAQVECLFYMDGIVKGPVGAGAKQRINQLEDPMMFIWKRTGFLPSAWELIQIENEAIPDDIWGYEPGSLRNAVQDLGF